jgi:triosephosphate isomerase
MNGSIKYCNETEEYFTNHIFENLDIIISTPNVFFNYLNKDKLKICAQNCSSEKNGPYTGETSVEMLNDVNIKYVLLGHSERRKHFHETPDVILSKMSNAIESNITTIVCVRRFSEDQQYIKSICGYLANFTSLNKDKKIEIIIAYEPDSSIGSGLTDSLYSIEDNYLKLKDAFSQLSQNQVKVKILYGGSVNSKNASEILKICDGILLGKASLDINELDAILKIANEIKS